MIKLTLRKEDIELGDWSSENKQSRRKKKNMNEGRLIWIIEDREHKISFYLTYVLCFEAI